MKLFSKIAIGIFSCAAIFGTIYYSALIFLPDIIDLNKYKDSVISEIEKESGFKVSCENISFEKTYTPQLKIHLYHTLIKYPDNKTFLKLKESNLKVKLIPLIFKRIEVSEINLTRPIINLILYKDYTTSIEKYIDRNKTINTNGYKLFLTDSKINCTDYKLKIYDESINKLFYLEGNNLELNEITSENQAHIITQGSLLYKNKKYINYDIDLISGMPEKQQFTFSPFKTIYESDARADIQAHLKMSKDKDITGELKISRLNFDKILSGDNNIVLKFKGKKAQVSSLLHTSQKDTVKLIGEYSYGKNKLLNVNAEANNISIENLHNVITETTQILNIKNPAGDINMTGILNADFNIKTNFKTLQSSGRADIINASIKHKSLPYSIDKINSKINFNNNKIVIEQALANVEGNPIRISGEVNKNVEYNFKAKSDNLDFVNIVQLLSLDKKGIVKAESGRLSFEANVKGVSDKTYSGDILVKNFNAVINKQRIKAETLRLLFDEHKITIPENRITSPVPLTFSGIIKNYKKNPSGSIEFGGRVPSGIIAAIIKEHINIPNKAAGYINTEGTAVFEKNKTHIKAKLCADLKNYISFAVIKELLNKNSVVKIDCDIANNNANINDLSLYESSPVSNKDKLIIGISGQADNLDNLMFKNLKITVPNYISTASNFAGGEEYTFKTDMVLNGKIKSPVIKGSAQISSLKLKKYLTSVRNINLDFSNNKITLTAPDVTVNNSQFNITADIIPPFNPNNITVSKLIAHSANLDFNTLFPALNNELLSNTNLNVKNGSITLNNVRLLDLKSNDVSADISLKNGIIKASNIIAGAYGGSVTGSMQYAISSKQIRAALKGKNIDVKSSLYDLCKLDDNLSGRADFNTDFTIYAGTYSNAIKSLQGNMNFTAKNGKMGTLGKFEYYLYAQNIMYHGLLNTTINRIADLVKHDNTTQYREAKGNLYAENGYLYTDKLTTSGTNMSLYIIGKHNLLANKANLNIYGRISDSVNSKLGDFANYSISDFLTQQNKKDILLIQIPDEIINKIPGLYNNSAGKTNIFKVNVMGDIKSPSSINSFTWISPEGIHSKEQPAAEEKELDFSDIPEAL